MRLAQKYFEKMGNAPEEDIDLKDLNSAQLYWFVLKNYFWRLILLNILFVASCIPIITIPASFSAVSRVCMKYLMGQHVELVKDYFSEWRNTIWSSWVILICGMVMLVMLGLACMAYYFLLDGIAVCIFLVICLLLALWVFSVLCYAFSIQAAMTLGIGKVIRNAVLMSVTEIKTTVILITLPGVIYFLCALFFPLTLPLLVFGIISLSQLAVCAITLKPIEKYAEI